MHPESYAIQAPRLVEKGGSPPDDDEDEQLAVWELPDTSILFRGYLEAGRMINVFDWYQSFAVVLEAQRRRKLEAGAEEQNGEDETMQEDEKWGAEVQARFIRGIHELDFMGFLKHTGRKPGHVARTAFDVSE